MNIPEIIQLFKHGKCYLSNRYCFNIQNNDFEKIEELHKYRFNGIFILESPADTELIAQP